MLRAVLLACILFEFAGAAVAAERLALLVGNSRYETAAPLRNPENDTELVAIALRAAGFQVQVENNLTQSDFRSALARFSDRVAAAVKPEIIFYFAGHGIQNDGENYLLPIDAKLDGVAALSDTSIRSQEVLKAIDATDTVFSVVILDACRDNPLEKQTRSAVPLAKGLAPEPTSQSSSLGQIIAYSTAPGEVATDGDSGTSPYASAFAETLLIPGLGARQVFDRVREKVKERTKGAQEPWESSSIYKEFSFFPGEKGELSELEEVRWDNANMVDSAESYQRYLDRHPDGRFSEIAKSKIASINKDFSYRRQAETFPYVSTLDGGIDFCSADGSADIGTLSNFQDKLVFVEFAIAINGLLCLNDAPVNAHLNAPDVVIISGSNRDCQEIIRTDEIDNQNFKRPLCKSQGSFKTLNNLINDVGAISINSGNGTLVFPTAREDYYKYDFAAEEGQYDYSYVYVSGLVRVHVQVEDDHDAGTVFLEPVDPAAVGLTWKFQNTIEGASSDTLSQGPNFTRLGRAVSSSDAEPE